MKKFTVYIFIMFAFPLMTYSQFTGGPGGGDISVKYENAPLAVTLLSFSSVINNQNVTLNWITEFENNNKGFDIERKSGSEDWLKVGYVKGSGTTSEPTLYTYTDKNLFPGEYNYRLRQMDYNSNFTIFELSDLIIITAPAKYNLSQNFPNPFNPVTNIKIDIPKNGFITLKVFDVLGREVSTLVNENLNPGTYDITFDGTNFNSGLYFYKLNAGEITFTKRMILVK